MQKAGAGFRANLAKSWESAAFRNFFHSRKALAKALSGVRRGAGVGELRSNRFLAILSYD
jgi:hypothetical protein